MFVFQRVGQGTVGRVYQRIQQPGSGCIDAETPPACRGGIPGPCTGEGVSKVVKNKRLKEIPPVSLEKHDVHLFIESPSSAVNTKAGTPFSLGFKKNMDSTG